MHIPNPPTLLSKYSVWDLDLGSDGEPIAFTLFKKTPFGLKSGLSGYDGSSEGKRAALHNLRTKYKKPGYYGEVSHKVKSIVTSSGAPVVCATFADKVLGKDIKPVGDGIHYQRSLGSQGTVTKVLVRVVLPARSRP